MTSLEFVSLQEASKQTGKSQSTLRRLISKIQNDQKLAAEVLKKESCSGGFKYSISAKYLHEKFGGGKEPKRKEEVQPKIEIQKSKTNDQSKSREVELLESQIVDLKEDKKQMRVQIDKLLEGEKELRILLLKEQDLLKDLQNKNILNIDIKHRESSKKDAKGSGTGKTARTGIDGVTFLAGLIVVLVISALMIGFAIGW